MSTLLVVAKTSRLRTLNVNMRILNSARFTTGFDGPALVDEEADEADGEGARA